MSTVFAAVEDSPAARPVLETALALAPLLGAQVVAVHVADEPGETAVGAARSLGVELRTLRGDPTSVLVEHGRAEDVVAVVVGARDRLSAHGDAGHVALALAGELACPVVVVPPAARPPVQLRRVLIGIQGLRRDARRLRRAIELTEAAGLEIFVVHVDDDQSLPLFSDQLQYESEVWADEFLARSAPGVPRARVQLRVGSAADELLAAADDVGPDVVVVGWPHGAGHGHVAREVVRRSSVPVLLVALEAR